MDFTDQQSLLEYFESRLRCSGHAWTTGEQPDWLQPTDPVDLDDYGVSREHADFDFDHWRETPNPAFGGRSPQQVIKGGSEADRARLATVIDAIAALRDGAFS